MLPTHMNFKNKELFLIACALNLYENLSQTITKKERTIIEGLVKRFEREQLKENNL